MDGSIFDDDLTRPADHKQNTDLILPDPTRHGQKLNFQNTVLTSSMLLNLY